MLSVYFLRLGALMFLAPAVATQSGEARCSETTVNVTREDIQPYGSCLPYRNGSRPTPCDVLFTSGVDLVYLPNGRAGGSLDTLNSFAADTNVFINLISEPCREVARKAVCYFYYPPCGNVTTFEPPKSLCRDECAYVVNTVCPFEWHLASQHFAGIQDLLNRFDLHFINCSNPATYIEPLPHCCLDGLVQIDSDADAVSTSAIIPISTLTPASMEASVGLGRTSTAKIPLPTPHLQQPSNSTAIISSSVSAAVFILILVVAAVTLGLCIATKITRKKKERESLEREQKGKPPPLLPMLSTVSTWTPPVSPRYFSSDSLPAPTNLSIRKAKVTSSYLREMSEAKLLIPSAHIHLLDSVGQGEFGVVYRAHLTGFEGNSTAQVVAVKTLKSTFTMTQVSDMMEESLKMKAFSHPHVLNLIGVCIDGGESPHIVMPYMAKGSLLAYLRRERPNLTIAEGASEDLVVVAQKKLLSMCLQIVKGMEYLAREKFVHRDLAARNCMIDDNFVIKVADFGLTKDIYARNYFRQAHMKEEGEEVKLPARWMALESLVDGIFSEKSDVWSYGVTCWEVFSLGKTPYPGIDPFSLVKFLESEGRLEKPANAACSQEYYEVILSCWKEHTTERPSFSDLVVTISSLLEGIAGYLDFSLSPRGLNEALTTSSYDHLTELDKAHSVSHDSSELQVDKDHSHENSEIKKERKDCSNYHKIQD